MGAAMSQCMFSFISKMGIKGFLISEEFINYKRRESPLPPTFFPVVAVLEPFHDDL